MPLFILAVVMFLTNPMSGDGSSTSTFLLAHQTADRHAARDSQKSADTMRADRPNPDASGTYHLGFDVVPPLTTYSVPAEFTDEASRTRVGGTCVVALIVDAQGVPRKVHVSRSIAGSVAPSLRSLAKGLDANAVDAVKQYRYQPATYHGKPVPFETTIEVEFVPY
ncbi:MAG: energy transducer TonB [Acidobacteriaceae bacterium]